MVPPCGKVGRLLFSFHRLFSISLLLFVREKSAFGFFSWKRAQQVILGAFFVYEKQQCMRKKPLHKTEVKDNVPQTIRSGWI